MGGTQASGTQGIRGGKNGRGGLGSVLSGLAVAIGFVLFLGGFVWGAVVYQPYTVPTDSMMPTVNPGDRVLAERIDGGEVRRGDVVIFTDSMWSDSPMVKRVVGIGGDTVKCCGQGGRLTVNGKELDEPYIEHPKNGGAGPSGTSGSSFGVASDTPFEVTVPEGNLFLLGDRRGASLDSRAHLQEAGQGTVARSAVSARVDALAWPSMHAVKRPQTYAAFPGGISRPGPLRLQVAAVVAGAALVVLGAAYGPLARVLGRGRRREQAGVS
ncbi:MULTISPECIES: signal peptidase I [unclassified Streptomyces]|uniref:signal peptidase I n=1 Tax=unclassified Streptomyces TaxID=2593676 RepID=UPI001BE9C9B8|nr:MULTISPECIES: signal peptidase I [unclassified Streptomyces]MBT2406059.1 signal peptidase I [Streptomyces sp. ISL-21]MBT2453536.1 signal peptidase I [Streptomyces sp. ISL-86]MBT2610661.1 signal peptidase I [Streptomyces sp. ISL-87]